MRARWVACLCVLVLAGCERLMHDMYEQPRYTQGDRSPLFDDGGADRPPPAGSVPAAMGTLASTTSGRLGRDELAARAQATAASAPPPPTRALLLRGQERYGIYCLPCHSALGDGDGPVVRHGFPQPPSFHAPRLRDAPDRHFYDVMTNGHGIMYSYADRITPEDRWAIVAFVRALQLSQAAPVATLPAALRARLPASGATR